MNVVEFRILLVEKGLLSLLRTLILLFFLGKVVLNLVGRGTIEPKVLLSKEVRQIFLTLSLVNDVASLAFAG